MDDTMDTNNNDSESEVPTCTEYDVSSAIAESEISKNYTDMPLQELPEFDNLDEDQVSSLPTYETAARLRTVKLSVSAGLSYSTADDLKDDATDNKSLQELPGYDEIDEDKTAAVFNSSFPTYETASKLNTTNLKMKGTSVAIT